MTKGRAGSGVFRKRVPLSLSLAIVFACGAAGYAAAGTLPGRLPRPRALAWPRIGIYHSDDERRFRMKVSRTMRWLRGSRIWPG